MSGLDVDTRSDIYALGVLLYELLTGTTPFDKERLRTVGFDEIRRIIREEEPPRPSTRFTTPGKDSATVSANRKSDARQLSQLFRGELDWIVLKALEKDRNRRYESASAFAADVQRFLNDEPVQACPPSLNYRLRKLARRNRSALSFAGVLLLFLIVLASGAGWVVRDRAARETELTRDRQTRQAKLNHEIELALQEAGAARERALTLTDNPYQWQAVLAAAASAHQRARGLASQDEAALDPALNDRLQALAARLEADETDRRFVARFEEIRLEQTQIRPEGGEYKLEIAYLALKEAFRTHYQIDLQATSAEQVLAVLRRRPEAIQDQLLAALDYSLAHAPRDDQPARQWLIVVLETADPDPWRRQARRALAAQDWPALEKLLQDRVAERQPLTLLSRLALALPRESPTQLQVLRQMQHSHPDDFWANQNLAGSLHYRLRSQWDEAIRYYTAALALRPRSPATLVNLGNALWGKGDLDGAIVAFRDAVAQQPDYAGGYSRLGLALVVKGCIDEAADCFRSATRFAPLNPHFHYDLGQALRRQHQLDEAIAAFTKAIELDGKHIPALTRRAQCYHQLGRLAAAHDDLRKALDSVSSDAGQQNELAWFLANCPEEKLRDPRRAVELARKAVELSPQTGTFWNTLGAAHYRAGDWKAALDALRTSEDLFQGNELGYNAFFLAMAHLRLGDKDEARKWYNQAVQWMEKHAPKNGELLRFRAEAEELLKEESGVRSRGQHLRAHQAKLLDS
jgi:tetratricopeptide (TPR) repeat protein